MIIILIRRLLHFAPICLIVILLSQSLVHLIPGDPVDWIAGDFASEMERQKIRENLGLNRPLSTQVLYALVQLGKGDLGRSLISQKPVTSLISERMSATFELAFATILFSLLFSIPTGFFIATQKNRTLGSLLSGLTLISNSIPTFWLGPLLILIFSVHLGWLPVSGRTHLGSLILPVLTLSLALSPHLVRMTRIRVLHFLDEDFTRTARSKGLSEFTILFKHILKNISLSLISIVSGQLGALITGALITERVFDWPGLGTLISEAIEQRDYPVVQGCVLFFSFSFLIISLTADLLYLGIDPRIRAEHDH